MVEEKKLVGVPLGMLIPNYAYVRTIAQSRFLDFSRKSGAPKLGRPGGTVDYPSSEDLDLLLNKFFESSLEEAQEYYLNLYNQAYENNPAGSHDVYMKQKYFDYSHEIRSRYGWSTEVGQTNSWVDTTGIGNPNKHVGSFNTPMTPMTAFTKAYYYCNSYVKDVKRSRASNYFSGALYPHVFAYVGTAQIDLTKKSATFQPQVRQRGVAFALTAESGEFKLKIGNWTSPTISIDQTVNQDMYNPFVDTNGVSISRPMISTQNNRIRSLVWIINIDSEALLDQLGGVDGEVKLVDVSLTGYFGHKIINLLNYYYKLNTVFSPINDPFGFQYDTEVELIGHYLDLSDPKWSDVTRFTSVSGPAYLENVLGHWKLLSFTVGADIDPTYY